MTTTQRPRPPRQAPAGPNPAYRGLILVIVAVVLGAILLIKGGGIGFQTDAKDVAIGTGGDTTPVESTVPPSTTPPTSVTPAALKVVVLNGAGINGYAATAANFLSLAGYPTTTAQTAAAPAQTTTVYFAPGNEGDAQAIAKLLSIGAVQPIPTGTVLGKAATDVPADTNVVVVLGPDVEGIISPAGSTGTTTTVAGAAPTTAASSGTSGTSGSGGSTIPASGSQTPTTKG